MTATAPSLTGTTVTITSEVFGFGTFDAEVVATVYSFEKIIAVEAVGPDGVRRMFWEWTA